MRERASMPGSKLMRPFSSSFTWASNSLILACSFAGSEISVFMADTGSGSGPWRGTREERPVNRRNLAADGRKRALSPAFGQCALVCSFGTLECWGGATGRMWP